MDRNTSDRLNKIRSNYDALAGAYAREISGELDHRPLERKLLAKFAAACGGLICDLGCGPGHVTEYLSQFNVSVIGLDLSSGILKQARARHSEIIFLQGNMLNLPFAAAKLAGIIAFYSIIHFDETQLARALAEMSRVLRPGGLLLLGVHVGRDVVHVNELWGIPVDFEAVYFDLHELIGNLESHGFKVMETVQREPHPEVEHQSIRGYIWAQRATS
jgi:ubiquinone/menaquinone biosynthesis C-methylase UbiE